MILTQVKTLVHIGRIFPSIWGTCARSLLLFLSLSCQSALPQSQLPQRPHREARPTEGHLHSAVKSIAFSPDGKFLASAADDRTIRLWDLSTGKQIRAFTGHTLPVNRVSFAPDGKSIASSIGDGTVRVWAVDTGRELLKMMHGYPVKALAFSPDGQLLATACEFTDTECKSPGIELWNALNGEPVRQFVEPDKSVESLAFSPDGRLLASAGYQSPTRLWEVSSGKELRHFEINNPTHPPSVSFSPDGTMLSIADWSTIHLLEVGTFRELRNLDRPQGLQVAFSPDGQMLAASGADPLLVVWDTRTWVVRRRGFHEDVGCPQVAFSPDGKMLAEAYYNVVRLFDTASLRLVRTFGEFAPEPE
jgi:WD40 repeat protein